MLTNSLNEARVDAQRGPPAQASTKGPISADALRAIAANTASLKAMEAQIKAVIAFGGIQNTKAGQQAKDEYEREL